MHYFSPGQLAAFILGTSLAAIAAAQPVQWRVEDGGNGHWYEGVSVPAGVSWESARNGAIGRGGYLAALTTSAENQWVFDHVANNAALWPTRYGPWIGLYQDHSAFDFSEPGGGWRWVTGEPVTWLGWDTGEPNNLGPFSAEDYAHFVTVSCTPGATGSAWNDMYVSGTYPADSCSGNTVAAYIVEYPTAPTIWTNRSVAGPSARDQHAMAFDSARGVTVLFGGRDNTGVRGDTWEWNGSSWTPRLVNGPSPRLDHAMAYDSARHVTVLFGGNTDDLGTSNGETWEWNGAVWTQRMVPGPSPRRDHALAFDSARGVTVLFGGANDIGHFDSAETWEWNGTAWTQRTVDGPSARDAHAMAYDSARGVTVLFGGYNNNSDTWEWNGSAWTQRIAVGPSARQGHAMTYDSARNLTVLFGGFSSTIFGETWEWNGASWTQRAESGPSPRDGHAMAFDTARGITVLFGGITDSGLNAETWEMGATCAKPFITSQPPLLARLATNLNIPVGVPAGSQYSYRWRKDGTPISNGFLYGGANTVALAIHVIDPNLQGDYTLQITNACGPTISNACHVVCAADFDDGSATGTPDGGVTIDDLLYYLSIFSEGLIAADVDDGSGTGALDGGVTIDDLLYYLTRFTEGC